MSAKPRLIGVNHVALEVGNLDAALDFYASVFELELRGRIPGMAFIEMGDQFLALSEGRHQPADTDRHFGLVVDDIDATRSSLETAGAEIVKGRRGLDFLDPWGNLVQVVDYRAIQFTKEPRIKQGMGLADLDKHDEAIEELREKGLAD